MVKAKQIIYSKQFDGLPKLSDFVLKEEELPSIKDGEFLAKALYHSVDPYIRLFMPLLPLGSTIIGGQIALIVESKNENYPNGSYVYGEFGWRCHTIVNPTDFKTTSLYLLPDFGKHPLSLGLGTVGMSGASGYFGLLKICKPKSGDVVVVSGAAGAVGSVVGQIAKIKGCTVIGITGSDEKCKWLTNELEFNYAINYKTENVATALKTVAPNGINCYFDNVAGEISSIVLDQMADFGRIAACGYISSYNSETIDNFPQLQPQFIWKHLTMKGFQITDFSDEYKSGINELLKWVQEGKIKYKETITIGFEHIPQAFIEMLNGRNIGKAIVKSGITH